MGFILFGLLSGLFWGFVGAARGMSLSRVMIYNLITYVLGALLISSAQADRTTAMQSLRQTTAMSEHNERLGTMFIARGKSGKRYLVSAWHVCRHQAHGGYISAIQDDGTVLKGKIVKMEPVEDFCAALLPDDGPALSLASDVVLGEQVFTRGYPMGHLAESAGRLGADFEFDHSYDISEVHTCPRGYSHLYSDGDLVGCGAHVKTTKATFFVEPGSSGSPVVDSGGGLVGVAILQMEGDPYQAGMVPFQDVRKFMSAL